MHNLIQLYHYTRPGYVPSILNRGLIHGDVPTSPTGGFNAPWLTDDPEPDNQQWGAVVDKKTKLIVTVPEDDPYLVHWPELAALYHVEQWWFDALEKTGGPPGCSEHWYVYLGEIPPAWIKEESHAITAAPTGC